MTQLKPGNQVVELSVSTVENSTWRLADKQPKYANLIVFYRGLHCPVCKQYLQELNGKIAEFHAIGVEPIAISGDSEEKARDSVSQWNLSKLDVGYGQSVDSMREWGLYVSTAIREAEPERFGEPGMFVVDTKGTLLWAAVQSMPFGRPEFDDVLSGLKFMLENNYPPRGTA